ncbi:Ger(x)C family spore germination protein [Metabacillus fastidiosus]|uniref:Ger(x)C family spore germination protein n=1 Tax=Metabacillus fastidiosus TaxID=1458 RepID=UPI0008258B9E|nr:Ger(x)C family spore germination protein [Metabacillus fastidiosus]MED4461799.1 Ger(x)C family spore germination protein [Metabacillus fastidiosus]
MTKYISSFLFFLLVIILSGCYDSRAPERIAYAHGMAIDYKDGEYIVYLQLINYGMLAKSEASGGDQDTPPDVRKTGKGKNINEAIFNIYPTAQQEIYFGNLSFVILSDRLLKEKGIKSVVDIWSRYPETRYQIYFYTGDDIIEQIIAVKPVLDVSKSLNRLADPKNSFEQNSTTPIVTLRELLIALNEPGHTAVIPKVFLTHDEVSPPMKAVDIVGFDGITLYNNYNKFLGNLMYEQAYGYRWINKKFSRTNLQLLKDNETLATVIINDKKTKITPIIRNNSFQFKIKVEVKGSISEIDKNGATVEEMKRAAIEQIKSEIMRTYTQALEMDADVYRLSEVLYRKNLSVWKQYEEKGKIPLDDKSIDIDVKVFIEDAWKDGLRRSGE